MMNGILNELAATDSKEHGAMRALALDISTSSVRAALYDAQATALPGAEAHLDRTLVTTVDGGAEMDARVAIEQIFSTIDALCSRLEHGGARVDIVSVSCFWHSLVGVDIEGRAISPLFGWADARAGRAATELRQRFDEPAVHARTGCRFHSSYWPAKLLWLQRERAEIFRRARRWMSLGELLLLSLFGETAASLAMASGTGLLNLHTCDWDEELCGALQLSPEQLPAIAEEHRTFVGLKNEYAGRWPQLRGARWFPVVPDGAANNIGAGCTTHERAALMVGTSGALRVMYEGEPPLVIPESLWCYRFDKEHLLVGGALSDGGGLHAWLKERLNFRMQGAAVERALAAMEPDSHGLTVLPFWAGERSTGWHSSVQGALLGLTMHTEPLDILRAAMEAIAYRFALMAEALETLFKPFEFIATGGALEASPVWAQIIADALGRSLKLSGVHEASTRGSVLVALSAAGLIESVNDYPAPILRTFEPDMAHHARYLEARKRQQNYYDKLILE